MCVCKWVFNCLIVVFEVYSLIEDMLVVICG